MGMQLKEVLRNLCCSNGWLYAVLWRIRSRDSMLLVPEDAYYDGQMGMVIDKMLHQVHVMGEGIIGQVAFSGKHRWIFSDTYCGELNSTGLVDNLPGLQDTSEWGHQFSSGIKTIAVISLSSQSVVQFGSEHKIVETSGFVDHVRSAIQQLENFAESFLFESAQKTYNTAFYVASDGFASVISSNGASTSYADASSVQKETCEDLVVDPHWPSLHTTPLSQLRSGLQQSTLQPCASAQVILSTPNMQLPQVLQQPGPISLTNSGPGGPTANTWRSEVSNLTSLEELLSGSSNMLQPTSSNTVMPSQNTLANLQGASILASNSHAMPNTLGNTGYETGKLVDTPHSFPLINSSEGQPSSGKSYSSGGHFVPQLPQEWTSYYTQQEELNPSIATFDQSKPNLVNDINKWTPQPPEQVNNCLTSPPDGDLSQALGVASLSSGLVGGEGTATMVTDMPRYLHNSRNPLSALCDGKRNSLNTSYDFFDKLGDLGHSQHEGCWDDILLPVGDDNNLSTGISECISELDLGPSTGSRKEFSEFGLEQLLDAVAGNVNFAANNNSDDQSSVTTFTRAANTTRFNNQGFNNQGFSNQVLLPGFSRLGGGMEALVPQCNSQKTLHGYQKDTLPASLVSSWISGTYSESGVTVQPKRSEERAKLTRKRARPGESTRPRPKDRQQIQDRVKELRDIVPNGAKCSIDSLLDRTVKHMLFLQSVTKYADKLKQVDEPKMIDKENGVVLRDNSNGSSGGATWAFEVEGQTMVCPIIVEDLSPPGQMLVEMLCEERGFFLEIADIIRSFGLTILKGVMEIREDKIWARFVVEANREITRMDIFLSLVQLLQQTAAIRSSQANQSINAIAGSLPPMFTHYSQPSVPIPVSLADRVQ